jgi:hypothetical protein
MALLQWGTWTPDTTDFEGTGVRNIQNVIPRGDGYGPWPDFAAATQALPAACRGGLYALKSDGSIQVFAGTSLGLYKLNNTDLSWTPVGRVATCTISAANPAVVTYTNTFVANEPIVFSTTGALPHGGTTDIVAGTVYYVSATSLSGSSFKISATPGGAVISTAGASQSGTQSVTGHYAALTASAQWQFAQTGNLVWATQANDVLQVFDLSSATAFSNSLGSPPQAAYISVVGRFLVLSGLLSSPYTIQWSGLNNFNASTSWDNVTLQANSQNFPDGGVVRGVAGGEFGVIFQDQAIRSMSYVGGAVIFQIERITQDMGLFAPYSIVRAGSTIYFYAGQGFHKINPGQAPVQIGREKVDRTFRADLDQGNLQLFMGASDPRTTRVYWAYKSGAGAVGTYDKILGYDSALDRFFNIAMTGEYLLGISQSGLTLENLDTLSSSIDALTLTLDAYANSVQPEIAQFDTSHKQGFFRGHNLEGTMQSSEQGTDGNVIFINGFKHIGDAATAYGSLSWRETQADIPTVGSEVLRNPRTGNFDVRKESRYQRMQVRIPIGTSWTFSAGIEPSVNTSGLT